MELTDMKKIARDGANQENGEKNNQRVNPWRRWLLSAAIMVGIGACGDYTIENHIPIPNPTDKADAGQMTDAGQSEDGGPKTDGGITGLDGGDGGQTADGGPVTDGGVDQDGGPVTDGGVDQDGGPIADGGVDQDGGPITDAGTDQDSGVTDGGIGPQDGGVLPDGGIEEDAGIDLDGGIPPVDGGTVSDGGAQTDGGSLLTCDIASTGNYHGYVNEILPVVVGGYSFYYDGEGAIPDGGTASARITIKCGSLVVVPTQEYEVGIETVIDAPGNRRIKILPFETDIHAMFGDIRVEEIALPNDGGVDAGEIADAGSEPADGGYNPPACSSAGFGTLNGYINKIHPSVVGGYAFLYVGMNVPDGGTEAESVRLNIACGGAPVVTDLEFKMGIPTQYDISADYRRITATPIEAGEGSVYVHLKVEYH